jgi:ferrochelatase
VHSQHFAQALRDATGLPCELGMRYGKPSLASAVNRLVNRGVRNIRVLLMYPQHADSTRVTSIELIGRCTPSGVTCTFLSPFFDHKGFISSLAGLIRSALPESFDHLLLSYHGLPEDHIRRADPTRSHCLASATCCETPSDAHATCYRHQVRRTSALLGQALDLPEGSMSVSFQSRLGRQKWLEPYTDQILKELPSRGVKHLVVACPAFVADNLETLEEIGMQGREIFERAGGKTLTLIPCLNSDPAWVTTVAQWCTPEASTPLGWSCNRTC